MTDISAVANNEDNQLALCVVQKTYLRINGKNTPLIQNYYIYERYISRYK